ncbi:unnamed protein product [Caenorhabditis bovis]|uniref:Uncharacterized protein n=1 Tax=Caenorhabditis bovis TaxID=2654633 RepID=A0A8S1FB40_9PELO|nr:unnamed protein product [Caenorhabditis bovis]
MGITGLWKILEPTSTEIPLECLEGKKLAVDVSIWIYQAQTAYPSDQPYPHIRLLINRLCKLLYYKIRPVFVFDGPEVPALKKTILESRRLKKIRNDDILSNSKKMHHLKQIAAGELNEDEFQKSLKTVISPSKRTVLNDIYKDVPTSSIDTTPSQDMMDRLYVEESSDEDDEVIFVNPDRPIKEDLESIPSTSESLPESFYESVTMATSKRSHRENIDRLVEQRERMRKTRLNPSMIPSDSNDFSKFQLQRILKRGRLNAEIDKMAKPSFGATGNERINVTGPDGTQHILKYANSDEIQVIDQEKPKRDINIYQEADKGTSKDSRIELSLDLFSSVYCDSKEDVTVKSEPIEFKFEKKSTSSTDAEYHSKSGLLEAIARKRIKLHYDETKHQKDDDESSDDSFIDVSDDEQTIKAIIDSTSKSQRNFEKTPEKDQQEEGEEEEWDPQRYDKIEGNEKPREDYVRLDFEEDAHTPELYRDLQEFLTNCGIPWIEAPGEAEAQCVELERLGLVDGIISDDSDVWAFGARHVYRHMFAKNKRVQRYGIKSTKNANSNLFCLQREDYISIAILSGADYSAGLNKVGAVGALELISEFVEKRNGDNDELRVVEQRILTLLDKVRKTFICSAEELPSLNVSREIVILRRHVQESNDSDAIESICSNKDAIRAYLHPTVDKSTEVFKWRRVSIELIRQILNQKLNWPEEGKYEEKNTIDALERWNEFLAKGGKSQHRLDAFFAQPYDTTLTLAYSKKVTDALTKISKKSQGVYMAPKEAEIDKKKAENAAWQERSGGTKTTGKISAFRRKLR